MSRIVFNQGVFPEEVLRQAWERQKFVTSSKGRGLLNLLDYPEYMGSIRGLEDRQTVSDGGR